MLLLLFRIGNERFAINAGQVVEVIPLLALNRVPHAPKGVAGLVNYHGEPVVAIDLSELLTGSPALERLSTRMIMIRYGGRQKQGRLLALIAENATEMVRKEPEEFSPTGISLRGAPYLGPVLLDSRGSIQMINHDLLIPEKAMALPAQFEALAEAGSSNSAAEGSEAV